MKIMLFIPTLGNGGAERVFVDYANGLANQGFKVYLVCLKGGSYESDVSKNVKIIKLNVRMRTAFFPFVFQILKIRPRVLLSGLTGPNLISAMAGRITGVSKIITSVHNDLSTENAITNSYFPRLEKPLVKLFCTLSHKIIAVSEGVKDYLLSHKAVDKNKIEVIYNPIYKDSIIDSTQEELPRYIEDRLDDQGFIVSAGRLVYQKGFDLLIDAYANAFQSNESPKLIILGEGPEREKLEEKIKNKNLEQKVILPGFLDNPYPIFSKARLYVLSSRWEGFGNVIVEALTCGTPVLAFDCRSGPREILEDLDSSYLVPNGSVKALSVAMYKKINEEHDCNALAQYSQRFSVEVCVEKIAKVIVL
ncbi:glycosyltransferase [Halomonas sp. GXIMD04776]|uniref:glycosyltransferase n=1 Tax=Halomonas sp. GXIMD04776 TaxID=3415605 RepID=UPI003CBDFB09